MNTYRRHRALLPGIVRSCSGNAMVEFTLCFPLTLGVILYIMEAGIAFNTSQDVAALSREGANIVYRHCLQKSQASSIEDCVKNTLHDAINELATANVDRFNERNGTVIVSLYRWSVVNNQWERQTLDTIPNNTDPSVPTSKLDPTIGASALDTSHGLLIAVEAFYDFEPLVLGRGLGIALPSRIYHVTLI